MRHPRLIAVLSAAALLMGGAAQADNVFDLGGTRNADGSWNGLASLEFVTVGNPGNEADVLSTHNNPDNLRFGAVDYVYQIGTFEVTAAQYTVFLNAVAATDTYGLYNTSMWSHDYGCKIERSGTSGSYTYSVAADRANRPVNYVPFWDAARFVNWLHNDQPTGAQGPGTTEDGAYINIGNQSTFARQPDALYWIPTENEWYKAAYYDPTLNNGDGGYWLYPTQSNSVTGRDMSELTNPGNNANHHDWDVVPYPIDSPYYTTVAGEFELSQSYYGTFDQGGNVLEWNETAVTSSSRGLRGGAFHSYEYALQASYRVYYSPGSEYNSVGFRVASIPEPASITLLVCCGVAGLLWHGRRRVRR